MWWGVTLGVFLLCAMRDCKNQMSLDPTVGKTGQTGLDPPLTTFSGGTSKLVSPQEAVHGEPFAFALWPKLG